MTVLTPDQIDDEVIGDLDLILASTRVSASLHRAMKIALAATFHCRDAGVRLELDDICPQCAGDGYQVEPDGAGDTRDVACPACHGTCVLAELAAAGRTL